MPHIMPDIFRLCNMQKQRLGRLYGKIMPLFVPDNLPVGSLIRQEAPGGSICIVSLAGEAPSNHKADLLS